MELDHYCKLALANLALHTSILTVSTRHNTRTCTSQLPCICYGCLPPDYTTSGLSWLQLTLPNISLSSNLTLMYMRQIPQIPPTWNIPIFPTVSADNLTTTARSQCCSGTVSAMVRLPLFDVSIYFCSLHFEVAGYRTRLEIGNASKRASRCY